MIKKQILIVLGVIFIVFLLANVIEAFDNTDTYWANWGSVFTLLPSSNNMPLPAGSWKNTAENYSMNGNILTAQLKNESGQYVQSSITVTPNATYSNINGAFVKDTTPTPAPTPFVAPFNPVTAPIKSATNNNLCLDVWQNSMNQSTQLDMWYCNGQTNQQWTLNNGNLVVKSSGQCMDVNEAGTAAGTVVQQYPCGNPQRSNQVWTYVNGTLRPSNAPNMCLDVVGSSLTTGAKTIINPCNGSPSQQFTA